MDPLIVSIDQASNLLGGLSRSLIYRLIHRDKLAMRKLGRRTYVTFDSVKALLDAEVPV